MPSCICSTCTWNRVSEGGEEEEEEEREEEEGWVERWREAGWYVRCSGQAFRAVAPIEFWWLCPSFERPAANVMWHMRVIWCSLIASSTICRLEHL